jgi:hypothetical protein
MDGWIKFWEIACIVGFVSYYIVVAVVIPFAGRDCFRLFHLLNEVAKAESPPAAGPGAAAPPSDAQGRPA